DVSASLEPVADELFRFESLGRLQRAPPEGQGGAGDDRGHRRGGGVQEQGTLPPGQDGSARDRGRARTATSYVPHASPAAAAISGPGGSARNIRARAARAARSGRRRGACVVTAGPNGV